MVKKFIYVLFLLLIVGCDNPYSTTQPSSEDASDFALIEMDGDHVITLNQWLRNNPSKQVKSCMPIVDGWNNLSKVIVYFSREDNRDQNFEIVDIKGSIIESMQLWKDTHPNLYPVCFSLFADNSGRINRRYIVCYSSNRPHFVEKP